MADETQKLEGNQEDPLTEEQKKEEKKKEEKKKDVETIGRHTKDLLNFKFINRSGSIHIEEIRQFLINKLAHLELHDDNVLMDVKHLLPILWQVEGIKVLEGNEQVALSK
ncbi:hypothetical protein SB775_06990 [Peribacillus sp. SIMBA_075]|uniref:hypothetical protein n=1 Tax=Peribacillus sp. SIMBA_075 TaxID=3085813 RepID=UPI00397D2351